MEQSGGGEFLNIKYPDLQKSIQVQRSVEKKGRIEHIQTPNNPKDRNEVLLNRLENIFNNSNPKTKERNIKLFAEKFLYPTVLIDPKNVPENYFELQKKISREQGRGEIYFNDQSREIAGKTLYNDQKKSLDTWVNYLTSTDSAYPSWFKYYTLKNVVKMGAYDKEKKEFSKRSKTTTGIFPDLNREALSFTYDVLEKHYLKHEKYDNTELNRILNSANFSKIYAYAIDKVTPASKENKEKTEGEWVKYQQGSNATPLYESLQGHGTGWCTAGEETAKNQLKNGDFYVYYSKDQDNKNTIPRIAIRMENGQIAEVRGIEKDQNLEANMVDIAKEKYNQLPGGEKYEKKDSDMKLLTKIDNIIKNNQELTKENLRFLYEIDNKIEGFGYKDDPRIEEIRSKRNPKSDLSFIFGCIQTEISLTREEVLRGRVKYHYGNLPLADFTSTKGLALPENIIGGDLELQRLESTEGLVLPKRINGSCYLSSLKSTEGLIFPEIINGTLYLEDLTSIQGLDLSKTFIEKSVIIINKSIREQLKNKYPQLNIV